MADNPKRLSSLYNILQLTAAVISICFNITEAIPEVPHLPFECYSHMADVNLALLEGPFGAGSDGVYCGDRFYAHSVQQIEAVLYAIEQVNNRSDLLPNITIGYVVVNTCRNRLVALARATYFIPDPDSDSYRGQEQDNCPFSPHRFDVIGLIGPGNSPIGVKVSSLMGLYEVPFIDTLATSDELSDKAWFPYYLRLVPPDKYLVKAMLDFLIYHNWTYASMVFSEGSWGENAARLVQDFSKRLGICVPVVQRVRSGAKEEDMEVVLDKLLDNSNARVVMNFLYDSQRPVMWRLLQRKGLVGRFIWVASDSMAHEDEGAAADGTFVIFQVTKPVPDYTEHYLQLTPSNRPNNPWMPKLWETLYGCYWGNGSENGTCEALQHKPMKTQRVRNSVSIFMDAVLVYAYALHDLLSDTCPEVFWQKSKLKDCISRPELLAYLKKTDLIGFNGRTQFDANGDKLGQYSIKQYKHDEEQLFTEVARWDQVTGLLTVHDEMMNWNTFINSEQFPDAPQVPPLSVCSEPCKPREYFIRQELPCCWECLECRDNERVVDNATGCELCPSLTWPDAETATVCIPIPPDYPQWSEGSSVALLLISVVGSVITIVVGVWFAQHRRVKIIKASSAGLSGLILFGIFIAFVTVVAFLAKPSHLWCSASRTGFLLSVTLIYAPLLVKTTRVYRIFSSGKHGTAKPRFISNRAQLTASLILLCVQVCLSVVSEIMAPPLAKLRMPVLTMPFTELYCDLTLLGLVPQLTFNLLLIALCAIFGFLTRRLPENFNESWYIFVSVATTTFLWLVFLPTYFTTFYTRFRMVLLSSCLLINATVTLVCLFTPKIYVLHFVNLQTLQVVTPGPSAVTPSSSTIRPPVNMLQARRDVPFDLSPNYSGGTTHVNRN